MISNVVVTHERETPALMAFGPPCHPHSSTQSLCSRSPWALPSSCARNAQRPCDRPWEPRVPGKATCSTRRCWPHTWRAPPALCIPSLSVRSNVLSSSPSTHTSISMG